MYVLHVPILTGSFFCVNIGNKFSGICMIVGCPSPDSVVFSLLPSNSDKINLSTLFSLPKYIFFKKTIQDKSVE